MVDSRTGLRLVLVLWRAALVKSTAHESAISRSRRTEGSCVTVPRVKHKNVSNLHAHNLKFQRLQIILLLSQTQHLQTERSLFVNTKRSSSRVTSISFYVFSSNFRFARVADILKKRIIVLWWRCMGGDNRQNAVPISVMRLWILFCYCVIRIPISIILLWILFGMFVFDYCQK